VGLESLLGNGRQRTTAAWSVPLVQLAAAVPAYATSVARTTLHYPSLNGSYTNATTIRVVSTVKTPGVPAPAACRSR
jgi:hypothetical protein